MLDAAVVGGELGDAERLGLARPEHDVHPLRREALDRLDELGVEAELQQEVRLDAPRELRVRDLVAERRRAPKAARRGGGSHCARASARRRTARPDRSPRPPPASPRPCRPARFAARALPTRLALVSTRTRPRSRRPRGRRNAAAPGSPAHAHRPCAPRAPSCPTWSPSRSDPPERDLDVELRQVRALEMVDQVRRREDQPPSTSSIPQPLTLAIYET